MQPACVILHSQPAMQQLDKFMCQMFNFVGVECGRTNIKPGSREGLLKGQAHNLFTHGLLKGQAHNLFTQITCILTGKPSFA